jgi:hypothetical protein
MNRGFGWHNAGRPKGSWTHPFRDALHVCLAFILKTLLATNASARLEQRLRPLFYDRTRNSFHSVLRRARGFLDHLSRVEARRERAG